MVNDLKSQIKELKEKLEASKDVTVDLKIKHFNAIPKNLQQFHEQMRNGDDTLPPFSQLDIYRTNKSTKGAYCKRKAIFNFMESYSEGIESFFDKYRHLSTLHSKNK